MRKLLTIMFVFMTIGATAQTLDKWEVVPLADEFGDDTGQTAYRLLVEGYFKNSAVAGQEMFVRVVDYGEEGYTVNLFEYKGSSTSAMGYSDCFGEVYVKREDGSVEAYRAFAPASGGLYFNGDSDFANMMRNNSGETIKVYVKQEAFNEYGKAVYLFTMTVR